MTRAQLEAVHAALVEIIDSWNDAAANEDRGRRNDAIHLTLFDDGSGRLGRRAWTIRQGGKTGLEEAPYFDVQDWHQFDDLDGLLRILADEGVEIEKE